MAALSSWFSPKICARNTNTVVVPPSMKALFDPSRISFSRFPILRCVHLIDLSHLGPGAAEVSTDFKNAAADFSTETLKTSHVKFRLQKECIFGDHIVLVGDHTILGSWDPANAIPMKWSDGHIWNVELDVPIETTMQFKFILKRSSGEICWQPGPDRIFKSWESKAVLIIAEDWENHEAQKVTEEQETVPTISGHVSNQMEDIVHSNTSFSVDTAFAKDLKDFNSEFFARGISTYTMEGNLMNSNREMKSGEFIGVRKEENVKNEEPGLMSQQAEDVLSGELGSTIVDSSFGIDSTME